MTDQLAPPQFTEIQNRLAAIESKLTPDADGKLVVQMWKADQKVYREQEERLKAKSTEVLRLTCANVNLTNRLAEFKQKIEDLFPMIAHGDAAHRKWLKEAIDEHFADTTAEGVSDE